MQARSSTSSVSRRTSSTLSPYMPPPRSPPSHSCVRAQVSASRSSRPRCTKHSGMERATPSSPPSPSSSGAPHRGSSGTTASGSGPRASMHESRLLGGELCVSPLHHIIHLMDVPSHLYSFACDLCLGYDISFRSSASSRYLRLSRTSSCFALLALSHPVDIPYCTHTIVALLRTVLLVQFKSH